MSSIRLPMSTMRRIGIPSQQLATDESTAVVIFIDILVGAFGEPPQDIGAPISPFGKGLPPILSVCLGPVLHQPNENIRSRFALRVSEN